METFSMETTARAVDWKAVETDYRTSNRSTRAIGATHDVSHTAVLNRARAEGWKRPDGSPPVEVESDAAAQTAGEVGNPVPEPVPSADDGPSDAELDHGARIQLTRDLAESMSVAKRELVLRVGVVEADLHPNVRDRIASLKAGRRAAILRHRAAVAQTVAVVESAKRAAERIETLRLERAEREADFPSLAVDFVMGKRDAAALADHRRAVEAVDDQLAAIKVAVPQLEQEARRMMNSTESLARAPDDIEREIGYLRAEAACAIVDARW